MIGTNSFHWTKSSRSEKKRK